MELKPCLCGSKVVAENPKDDAGSLGWYIRCTNPNCYLMFGYNRIWTDCDSGLFVSAREAARFWNTRPVEDELREEISRLTQIIIKAEVGI
jgi:hypothetical protein